MKRQEKRFKREMVSEGEKEGGAAGDWRAEQRHQGSWGKRRKEVVEAGGGGGLSLMQCDSHLEGFHFP